MRAGDRSRNSLDEVAGSIWTHWHAHPDVLVGLALLQGAYLLGVGPLRERYGLADRTDPRQTATFTLGVLVVFFSLLSPRWLSLPLLLSLSFCASLFISHSLAIPLPPSFSLSLYISLCRFLCLSYERNRMFKSHNLFALFVDGT